MIYRIGNAIEILTTNKLYRWLDNIQPDDFAIGCMFFIFFGVTPLGFIAMIVVGLVTDTSIIPGVAGLSFIAFCGLLLFLAKCRDVAQQHKLMESGHKPLNDRRNPYLYKGGCDCSDCLNARQFYRPYSNRYP